MSFVLFYIISRADTNIDQIQITNRIPILLKKKNLNQIQNFECILNLKNLSIPAHKSY